jgi:hypothetical protein
MSIRVVEATPWPLKIYPLACVSYSFELLESIAKLLRSSIILSITHNVIRSKLKNKVIDWFVKFDGLTLVSK